MKSTAKKLRNPKRALIKQLVFAAAAFAAMGVFSYWFTSDIVRENLMDKARGMIDTATMRLIAQRRAYEGTLTNFSAMLRLMLLRGNGPEVLEAYIDGVSDTSLRTNDEASGIRGFFGYFEALPGAPVLLSGADVELIYANDISEADWYKQAVAAGGEIVETVPYIDDEDNTLCVLAQSLLDDRGQRLGVVGIQVCLDELGGEIVETALDQGGYGVLLNQDFTVLFHPNEAFVGGGMDNEELPVHIFYQDLLLGNEVFDAPVVSYKGENAVAFFDRLSNGWRLGMVVPKARFYNSIGTLAFALAVLGLAFAAILIVILIRMDGAREKSDDENKKKSMFLANMSHEIRTPINAIVGMTAIGREASSSGRKDYCLSRIGDASRHLLSVVNDILDMSKIEANQLELSPAEFSFEQMLQQAVNVVNVRVEEKRHKLMVRIDPNIPKLLFADDQRLAQVIANLLSNAAKFSPDEGTIRLSARLLNESDGLCTIEVEVRDNGIGISEEQQARLFRAFQQAESSTTRKYGGTGLGLVISKSIVETMGGKIRIDSALGQGAAVTFNVTAGRVPSEDEPNPIAELLKDTRILAVDDDPEILDYLGEAISGMGGKADLANSASEAICLVEENGPYDIYFIDLRMPAQDGISLTWDIRAREEDSSGAVVIMTTSMDLAAVEQEAHKAGADKFLLKPLFPTAIADMIAECCGIASDIEEAPNSVDGIFAGKQILFAEDIDINREIVLALLEPTLLGIDCAENGEAALSMFGEAPEKYDMILMDIQMPKMDGYEAARRIRALDCPKAQSVPIYAMTANVFKEDIDKSMESGMNGHLGKPLDIDEVIAVLTKLLLGGANATFAG